MPPRGLAIVLQSNCQSSRATQSWFCRRCSVASKVGAGVGAPPRLNQHGVRTGALEAAAGTGAATSTLEAAAKAAATLVP
jgi:hypothetical protein